MSTDNQEKEGTSLQTQEQACLEYCLSKGYEVFKGFNETYSGLTLDRPKLTELRDFIKASNVGVVVVYCLDRFTRDPAHGVILTQELEKANVLLESVTETVEQTELGKLITYLRGFNSKIEAEKIKERTMRGKQAHLKMGHLPQGTGIGIYGYRWDKILKKRFIIDQEAEVVRKIFALVLKGTSFNKIAVKFNNSGIKSKSGSLWFPLTIRRIAKNITYTGKTYYGQTKRTAKTKVMAQAKENWILLPDITPPIITDNIFDQAQLAIQQTKALRPLKPNAAYLLTGFARCSKCGSTIGGTMLAGKYRYYQCRGAKPTATRGKICDAGYIKADVLENFVWERVIKLSNNPYTAMKIFVDSDYSNKTNIIPLLDKQIKQLTNKIKSYESKEKTFYELLASESVTKDYVLDAIDKLNQDKKEDEKQLKLLTRDRKLSAQAVDLNVKLSNQWKDFHNTVTNATNITEKRDLLKYLRINLLALPGNYKFTCFMDVEIKTYGKPLEVVSAEKEKALEAEQPELYSKDVVCHDPGYGITHSEDLVTIEQTSGCLPFHAYICQ